MSGAYGLCHRSVGIPHTWLHVLGLESPEPVLVLTSEGTHIGQSRTDIAEQMLAHKLDWVLYIDDDHVFHPGALKRLLRANRPIIGGLYLTRKPPYRTTAMRDAPDGRFRSLTPDECASGEILEVDALGMGFTLIRREVFEAIPQPWFAMGRFNATENAEDIWFCRQAKQAGFPVAVDTGLRIGHLGVCAITLSAQGRVVICEPDMATIQGQGVAWELPQKELVR